jgi:hypothetical protein
MNLIVNMKYDDDFAFISTDLKRLLAASALTAEAIDTGPRKVL